MPSIGSITPDFHKSGSSDIDTPNLGWIGAKAGNSRDLVTIDANGRVDQVVAVATAYNSTTGSRVALLGASVAAAAAQGTLVPIEKWDEDASLSMQCATAAGAAKATADNMKGKQFPLFRDANGNYVVNTDSNANPVVECIDIDPNYAVGEVGGTLICALLPAFRLA